MDFNNGVSGSILEFIHEAVKIFLRLSKFVFQHNQLLHYVPLTWTDTCSYTDDWYFSATWWLSPSIQHDLPLTLPGRRKPLRQPSTPNAKNDIICQKYYLLKHFRILKPTSAKSQKKEREPLDVVISTTDTQKNQAGSLGVESGSVGAIRRCPAFTIPEAAFY